MQGKHDLQKVTNRSSQKIQDILAVNSIRLENFNMSVKKKNNKTELLSMKKSCVKFCPNMIYVQYRILHKYTHIGIHYLTVQMQGMMGMMMPAMHTMPPSTQTVVINNNVWNTNNALMSAAVS